MFIISGGKGTGKTKALLEKAKAEHAIVVCENPDALRERAYRYGITGLDIISYRDFYGMVSETPVYIQDINAFIKYNFAEVKGYSLCIE